MGIHMFDAYSLLHMGTGFIGKYLSDILGLSFGIFIMMHIIFEILENTILREYINTIQWWPGGKPKSDSLINIIGDIISAVIGWHALSHLDRSILR